MSSLCDGAVIKFIRHSLTGDDLPRQGTVLYNIYWLKSYRVPQWIFNSIQESHGPQNISSKIPRHFMVIIERAYLPIGIASCGTASN